MKTLTIFLAALIAIVYAATFNFFYQLASPRSIPCFELRVRLAVVFVSVQNSFIEQQICSSAPANHCRLLNVER